MPLLIHRGIGPLYFAGKPPLIAGEVGGADPVIVERGTQPLQCLTFFFKTLGQTAGLGNGFSAFGGQGADVALLCTHLLR